MYSRFAAPVAQKMQTRSRGVLLTQGQAHLEGRPPRMPPGRSRSIEFVTYASPGEAIKSS